MFYGHGLGGHYFPHLGGLWIAAFRQNFLQHVPLGYYPHSFVPACDDKASDAAFDHDPGRGENWFVFFDGYKIFLGDHAHSNVQIHGGG